MHCRPKCEKTKQDILKRPSKYIHDLGRGENSCKKNKGRKGGRETLAIKKKNDEHVCIKMKKFSVRQKKTLSNKNYLHQIHPVKDSYSKDPTLEKYMNFNRKMVKKFQRHFMTNEIQITKI